MAVSVLPDRALTLWQPWAWLVANGHKNIENRPRGFSHKSFRGDFWIHASAAPGITEWAERWGQAHDLCMEILGHNPLSENPLTEDQLAFGAIIGRATITGIIEPVREVRNDLEALIRGAVVRVPWHFPDQYGFKVENARPLATPVPCRGHQGFWRVPPAVLEKLRGHA